MIAPGARPFIATATLLATLTSGPLCARGELDGPETLALGRSAAYELTLVADDKVDACDVSIELQLSPSVVAVDELVDDVPPSRVLAAGSTHAARIEVQAVAVGDATVCAVVHHRSCSERAVRSSEKPVCARLTVVEHPRLLLSSIPCSILAPTVVTDGPGVFEPAEWADVTPSTLPIGSLGNELQLYMKVVQKDLFLAFEVPNRTEILDELDFYFNADNSGGTAEPQDRRFNLTGSGVMTQFQGVLGGGFTAPMPRTFSYELDLQGMRMTVEVRVPLLELGGPAFLQAAGIGIVTAAGSSWPAAFDGSDESDMEPAAIPQCERWVIPCGHAVSVTQGADPGTVDPSEWLDALAFDLTTPVPARLHLKTANGNLLAMFHVQEVAGPGDRTSITIDTDDSATPPLYYPDAVDRRFRIQNPIFGEEFAADGTILGYTTPLPVSFGWEIQLDDPGNQYWVEYQIPLTSIGGPQPPSQLAKLALSVGQVPETWPVAYDRVVEQLMTDVDILSCACAPGDFSWTPTIGCVGQQVQFTDLSTNSPTSWMWDFGDGSPVDTAQHPTHTYAALGDYTVSLTATGGGGCETVTHQVLVRVPPTAALTVTPSSVCIDPSIATVINLDASTSLVGGGVIADPGGYAWSMAPALGTLGGGSGSTETLTVPAGTWGTTDVTVTITDSNGCSDSAVESVDLNGRPTAALVADRVAFCTDPSSSMDVALNASGSTFPDGAASTWVWTLDVGAQVGTGSSIVWRIPAGTTGTYDASIDVTDVNGCTHQETVQIEIYELPNPSFSVSPSAAVCASDVATVLAFDGSASTGGGGSPVADPGGYTWSMAPAFGALGGSTGSTETLTVPALAWGATTVTLSVVDGNTCRDDVAAVVTVHGRPTADLIADRTSFCTDPTNPMDVILNASGSTFPDGAASTWIWTLGVGARIGSGSSIIWRIPAGTTGIHNASVDVTDDNGCTHQATVQIEIYELPTPSFTVSPQPSSCTAESGTTVFTFDGSSATGGTGGPIADPGGFAWSMAPPLGTLGGSTGSTETLTVPALAWGTTIVRLDVSDGGSCSARVTRSVRLFGRPNASLVADRLAFCTDPLATMDVNLTASGSTFPDGGASTWVWTLDVGAQVGSGPNIIWRIPAGTTGIYNASIEVTDVNGCTSSETVQLEIFEQPSSSFTYLPTTAQCTPEATPLVIALDGTTSSPGGGATIANPGGYLWSMAPTLGALSGSTGPSETLTIPPGTWGTTALSLDVADSHSCSHRSMQNVTVYGRPTAVLIADRLTLCTDPVGPMDVNLDASSSTFPDGVASTWTWTLGIGSQVGSGSSITWRIPPGATGVYNASVDVTDGNGCSHRDSVQIEIYGLPTPTFSVQPATPQCTAQTGDLVLTFDGTASVSGSGATIPNPGGYGWTMTPSLGTLGGSVAPTETLTVPAGAWGSTDVTLGVTDTHACSSPESRTVRVLGRPTAMLTADRLSFCTDPSSPMDVALDAGGTVFPDGGADSWAWTLDVGAQVGSGSSITWRIPAGTIGLFTAVVDVTDANGCSHRARVEIEIYALPVAGFAVIPSPSSCVAETSGVALTFNGSASSAGAGATLPNPGAFAWSATPSLGTLGGSTGVVETLTVAPGEWGTTTVSLDLTNSNACSDQHVEMLSVHARPNAALLADRLTFCTDPLNPMDVRLDATGTTFPDGSPFSWNWTLDVGTPVGGGPSIIWRIPAGTTGIYNARFDVTDSNGCTHDASVQIEIFELPTPAIRLIPATERCSVPTAPSQIVLNGNTTTPGAGATIANPGGYSWSMAPPFGTLSTTNGAFEILTIPAGLWGTSTGILDVVDSHMCAQRATIPVVVHGSPTASVVADRVAFCTDPLNTMVVNLTATGTFPDAGASSWAWSVDVGSWTGTASTVAWQIPAGTTGVHRAQVDVIDTNGCKGVATVDIEIFEQPMAALSVSPSSVVCTAESGHVVLTLDGGASSAGPGATLPVPGGLLWSMAPAIGVLGGGTGAVETLTVPAGTWGDTTVTLDVTDTHSCSDQVSTPISIHGRPTATLLADRLAFCTDTVNPMDVGLDATSTVFPDGVAASWNWTFDVGALIGAGPGVTWRIPPGTAGIFNATVDAVDSNGCNHHASVQVEIYEPPTASFLTAPPTPLCTVDTGSLAITLDGTGSAAGPGATLPDPGGFSWSMAPPLGSLGTGTGASEVLSVPAEAWGSTTVTMAVVDSHSCRDEVTQPVVVHGRPTAVLSAGRYSLCVDPVNPMDVALDASATIFPDGTPSSWTWTLDVGTQIGIGSAITWQIPAGTTGIYDAVVLVEDVNGCSHQASVQVEIYELPTSAFAVAPQATVCSASASPVPFDLDGSTSSAGSGATVADPAGFSWSISPSFGSFGSGAGSTDTVAVPGGAWGTAAVSLDVTDSHGCVDRASQQIAVHGRPTAVLSADRVAFCTDPANPIDVILDASSSTFPDGAVSGWTWALSAGSSIGSGASITWRLPAGTTGVHSASVEVFDGNGCFHQGSVQIEIFELPSPAFSFVPSAEVCTATFGNIAIGIDATSSMAGAGATIADPSGYTWSMSPPLGTLGGSTGSVETIAVPSGIWGASAVTLDVADSHGCAERITQPFSVHGRPTVIIAADRQGFCSDPSNPMLVALDASATTFPDGAPNTWTWSTDVGVPAGSGPLVSWSIPAGTIGVHQAQVIATDSNGCGHQDVLLVDIYGAPIPVISAPATVCADPGSPTIVSFDASGSAALPPATLASYAWSTSAGTLSGSSGPLETVTLAPGWTGTLTVQLALTDSLLCVDSIAYVVEIIAPPTAVSGLTPATQCEGTPATVFTLAAVGSASQHPSDSTLSYAWSASEGVVAAPLSAATTLSIPRLDVTRTADVVLRVTDAAGCQSIDVLDTVELLANPSATISIGAAVVGQPASFSSSITGGESPYGLSWQFGDGGVANGGSPTHTYAAPGVYVVTLSVTDANGCPTTTTSAVSVGSDLAASLATVSVCAGTTATLSSSISGGIAPLSFDWTFGDGDSATTATASTTHNYSIAGLITASVEVTDAVGASIVADADVTVLALPDLVVTSTGPAVVGAQQTFTATVDPGVTVVWTFSDGETATGTVVTRVFSSPMDVVATATATDAARCAASASIDVAITDGATDIRLSKTVAPFRVGPGGEVEYSIWLRNGGGVLRAIVFEDRLPAGFVLRSGTLRRDGVGLSDPSDPRQLVIGPFELSPGAATTLRYRARVEAGVTPGDYDNSVTVRAEDALGQSLFAGPRVATVTVLGQAAQVDLHITKEAHPDPSPASPGGLVHYTVDYENLTEESATGVQVRDLLPSEFVSLVDNPDEGVVAASSITWTLDFVPPRGRGRFRYSLRIDAETPEGTVLRNVVVITSAEEDANSGDNKAIVDVLLGMRPDLSLTKSVVTKPDPAQAGGEATYTLRWRVEGEIGAVSAVVEDDYDEAQLELTSLPPGAMEAAGVITFALGDIGPGESGTLVYRARILEHARGSVDNLARIRSATVDAEPLNDVATAHFEIVGHPARIELQAELEPGDRCRRPQVEVALRSPLFDTAEAMAAAATMLDTARLLDKLTPIDPLVDASLLPLLRSRLRAIGRANVIALFHESGMGVPWVPTAPNVGTEPLVGWLDGAISLPFVSGHPQSDDRHEVAWCTHAEHRQITPQAVGQGLRAIAAYLRDVDANDEGSSRPRGQVLTLQVEAMLVELDERLTFEAAGAGIPASWTVLPMLGGEAPSEVASARASRTAVAALVAGLADVAALMGEAEVGRDDLRRRALSLVDRITPSLLTDERATGEDDNNVAMRRSDRTIALVAAATALHRAGHREASTVAASAREEGARLDQVDDGTLEIAIARLLSAVSLGDRDAASAVWHRLEAEYLETGLGVYRAAASRTSVDYTPSSLATVVASLAQLATDGTAGERAALLGRAATLIQTVAFDAGMQLGVSDADLRSGTSLILGATGEPSVTTVEIDGRDGPAPVLVESLMFLGPSGRNRDRRFVASGRGLSERSSAVAYLSDVDGSCRNAVVELTDRRVRTESHSIALAAIAAAGRTLATVGERHGDSLLIGAGERLSAVAQGNAVTVGLLSGMGVHLTDADGVDDARSTLEGYARWADLEKVPEGLRPIWLELGAAMPSPVSATAQESGGWDATNFDDRIEPAAFGRALALDVSMARAVGDGDRFTRFAAISRLHAATLKIEFLARRLGPEGGEWGGWKPILDASGGSVEIGTLDRSPTLRDVASVLDGLLSFSELAESLPSDVREVVTTSVAVAASDRLVGQLMPQLEEHIATVGRDADPVGLWYAAHTMLRWAKRSPARALYARAVAHEVADSILTSSHPASSDLVRRALALDAAVASERESARIQVLYRELRDTGFDRSFRVFLPKPAPGDTKRYRLTDLDVGAVLSALSSAIPVLTGEEQAEATALLREAGARMLFATGMQRVGRFGDWREGGVSATPPHLAHAVELRIVDSPVEGSVLFPGDFAHGRVRVTNPQTGSQAGDLTVTVAIPTGFRHVSGSTRIDGLPAADPVGHDTLSFPLGRLSGGQLLDLEFSIRAGADTPSGPATWTARGDARSTTADDSSPIETATVTGSVFIEDYGRIRGMVRLDLDGDGVGSAVEPGVSSVTVLLDDGTSRITDASGRFSIDAVVPASYSIGLIAESLPAWVALVPGSTSPLAVASDAAAAAALTAGSRDQVVGLVFRDRDGDGRRDRGEPTVAGAVVETDSGQRSVSDERGRYRLRVDGGRGRAVKLSGRQPYLRDSSDLRLLPMPRFEDAGGPR